MDSCFPYHCEYLDSAIRKPELIMKYAMSELQGVEFDTMIGTGLSGALIIPRLAESMGKYWFLVRKANEKSHSQRIGEGRLGHKWLFVDDIIHTGSTLLTVRAAIVTLTTNVDWPMDFVGAYTYGYPGIDSEFYDLTDLRTSFKI